MVLYRSRIRSEEVNKRYRRPYVVNPPSITMLPFLPQFPDNISTWPKLSVFVLEIEQYDIAVIRVSINFFQDERGVSNPGDLHDDAVVGRVAVIPV